MKILIQQVLDERVRPQLALHGGDLQFLDVKDGVVRVRLLGQCANCPSAFLTTEELIFGELSAVIPEVKKVVSEQGVSDELLSQARDILRRRNRR